MSNNNRFRMSKKVPRLSAAGADYPLAVGAGVAGVRTRHQPHSARSCKLTLRAVGAARGHPGKAPLACVWGVRGWALSHARPPVLGACGRGPLPTGFGCGECGREDPSPNRQRALLQAGFARCGGCTRAPGEGAPCLCVWDVRGWALSHARPPVLGACGRGPLPTGCGCGGCGRRDPSPTPQRALLRAGFARCGGGTRAAGGDTSCLCVGCPELGAPRCPTASTWGVQPGPTTHWL